MSALKLLIVSGKSEPKRAHSGRDFQSFVELKKALRELREASQRRRLHGADKAEVA